MEVQSENNTTGCLSFVKSLKSMYGHVRKFSRWGKFLLIKRQSNETRWYLFTSSARNVQRYQIPQNYILYWSFSTWTISNFKTEKCDVPKCVYFGSWKISITNIRECNQQDGMDIVNLTTQHFQTLSQCFRMVYVNATIEKSVFRLYYFVSFESKER